MSTKCPGPFLSFELNCCDRRPFFIAVCLKVLFLTIHVTQAINYLRRSANDRRIYRTLVWATLSIDVAGSLAVLTGMYMILIIGFGETTALRSL